ncbi:MAG: hypothetical protein WCA10_23135 [Terracidiphilus sp.]
MRVFTTIFLAEKPSSDTGRAEESTGDFSVDFSVDFDAKRGLFEIKRINLERITNLENRNWFVDDLPSED